METQFFNKNVIDNKHVNAIDNQHVTDDQLVTVTDNQHVIVTDNQLFTNNVIDIDTSSS